MFAAFLKPVAQCRICQQDWAVHNADDFPPYIVILVIGHVVVTGMAPVEVAFHPAMWVHLAIWIPMVIALAVALIQPVKGGVIAFQWWHRMAGFEHRRPGITFEAASPNAPSPYSEPPSQPIVTGRRESRGRVRRGGSRAARVQVHRRSHIRLSRWRKEVRR